MRRKRPPEHVSHERWLVSYADFITLLFAFFVVMFATAQVDKKKISQFAVAVHSAFETFGHSDAKPVVRIEPTMSGSAQNLEQIAPSIPLPNAAQEDAAQREDMATLKKELEAALQSQIERSEVAIRSDSEGVVISLREMGFYESGSPEIKLKSEPSVARIAEILKSRGNYVRIEGHTDNVPIHNRQYSSNWQLSSARATEMIEFFITRYGVEPARLSAGGYAEFHPAASNTTPEGRSKNRRVDIVVLNTKAR